MKPVGSRAFPLAAAMLFLLGQAYLIPKVFNSTDGLDFRLIWLSGKLWAQGIDPYSSEFEIAYARIFGSGPESHFWVYPPSWHPFAAILSSFEFGRAVQIWNLFNLSLLHGASLLAALALRPAGGSSMLALYLMLVGVGSLMQATPVALSIGQTSFILYFSIALFALSLRKGSMVLMMAAIMMAGFKPSIGAVLFVAALARPELRLGALFAVLAHLAVAVISGVSHGFARDFYGFLSALARYSDEGGPANAPQNLVGITQIFDLFGGHVSGFLLIGLAGALGFATIRFVADFGRSVLAICAVIGLLVVPLHTYDLTFTVLVLGVAVSTWPSRYCILASAGFLLLFRPENFAQLSGVMNPDGSIFPGSLLATIGLICVALASVIGRRQVEHYHQKAEIS
ncbi:hypothetical protein RGQ15_14610 [Paracoccus sp. MBLB3053]|uniref:DUF2029 domain-containing protein n=1 Tax=Paracoccus aurantius TaxID=3073814 RepID=A0ABU2HWA1_9RHOB|nr:hypothetical protein [Paracoccus sp. MBLB3053]MDS9468795.1 hypothetical protein [Paracoccus sp. MBLB3053]